MVFKFDFKVIFLQSRKLGSHLQLAILFLDVDARVERPLASGAERTGDVEAMPEILEQPVHVPLQRHEWMILTRRHVAVATMTRIIESAETGKEDATDRTDKVAMLTQRQSGRVSRALCEAAVFASVEMGTTVTAVFTASGLMARRLSSLRHDQRIIALTHRPEVLSELALIWAVEPLLVEKAKSTEEMLKIGEQRLLDAHVVQKGEVIVVMAGRLSGLGLSSSVTIFTVGGNLGPTR